MWGGKCVPTTQQHPPLTALSITIVESTARIFDFDPSIVCVDSLTVGKCGHKHDKACVLMECIGVQCTFQKALEIKPSRKALLHGLLYLCV